MVGDADSQPRPPAAALEAVSSRHRKRHGRRQLQQQERVAAEPGRGLDWQHLEGRADNLIRPAQAKSSCSGSRASRLPLHRRRLSPSRAETEDSLTLVESWTVGTGRSSQPQPCRLARHPADGGLVHLVDSVHSSRVQSVGNTEAPLAETWNGQKWAMRKTPGCSSRGGQAARSLMYGQRLPAQQSGGRRPELVTLAEVWNDRAGQCRDAERHRRGRRAGERPLRRLV